MRNSGVSPARKAACDILLAVERGQGHADDLLREPAVNALSQPDRNLATTLVLGVLRWQIRLDQQLKQFLTKPNAKLDAEVLVALRLGAFQLLHLDRIPAHAAIGESVELARQAGHRFASGMVNAVLRKLSRESGDRPELSDLNCEQAHSAWLVDRWKNAYGVDTARAICRFGQQQPELSLRVADVKSERELIDAGILLAPARLLTSARTVLTGDVTATPAFREGRVRIQDQGSQFIAEIAASTGLVQKVKGVIDTCAAPGGKTMILAERNFKSHIVACEASPLRLAALRERVAAFGGRIECRLADAAEIRECDKYDVALADVPCSGTGTLGRNPEIRHRLKLEDLSRHAERQRAILRAAVRAVKPGGCIVYSTCSLEAEENEQVVEAVLAHQSGIRQVPLTARIDALHAAGIVTDEGETNLKERLTVEGAVRLIPGTLGTDGFFVALLEKAG
ncbi:MAG TPA: transcription antitermination factor NusB [Terracidiphilus sp.]|nr:transcription antitermination factor NusB [Terracidiphilus sp.]